MIDFTIQKEGLAHNIAKARENGILIPTIRQMQHPETIPEKVQAKLKKVGMGDVDPLNLFRITWKNEPVEAGGLFRQVPNYIELPSSLTPDCGHGGKMVPHGLPQGGSQLRLSGTAPGDRPV